jgi:hypothetical protein
MDQLSTAMTSIRGQKVVRDNDHSRAVIADQERTVVTTIDAKQFEEICERVWRDRATVLKGSGELNGDATLMRAVFWRLCKAGINAKGCVYTDGSTAPLLAYQLVVARMVNRSGRPAFDSAPILNELVERYQNEVGNDR